MPTIFYDGTPQSLDALLQKGDVLECPCCGALNAYCWDDCTIDPNTGKRNEGDEDCAHDIYHVPMASCFEWQCGKCRRYLADADSPINHPCYTHSED